MSFVQTGAHTGHAGVPRAVRTASWPTRAELRLSVVVPTCRRPDLLHRCLLALVAQSVDAEAFEVIVVDDGRTRDTQALVNAFAQGNAGHSIRYIRPERGRGPAAARNAGWQMAHAPIIAFTDDDTVPDRDWLAHGERALGDRGIVAVAGRVVVPAAISTQEQARAPTDHELMTRGLESAEFVTANAFVRRGVLKDIGGFDTRFERPWREDSDLQFTLLDEGLSIARCDDAVVVHPVRPEAWGVSLRQQKNVFYDALLFKKHPRLYRERILPAPPLDYYLVVALSLAAVALVVADVGGSAFACVAIALGLIVAFACRRLRRTSRRPAHVVEMLVTSAVIPFLSVFWRLRGAWHFRVRYL